jgi:hypothetical protein
VILLKFLNEKSPQCSWNTGGWIVRLA